MQKIYAGGGYRGDKLAEKLKKELHYDLEITLRSNKATEFKPLHYLNAGELKEVSLGSMVLADYQRIMKN